MTEEAKIPDYPDGTPRGPDWVREFLTRWVMEMGSGSPCSIEGSHIVNEWYGHECIAAGDPQLRKYFEFHDCRDDWFNRHNASINQVGLDFIKGDK
jgi:hypothetical protein